MRRTVALALSAFIATSVIGCSDEHATTPPIVEWPDTLPESASGGALIRVNGVAVGRAVASGGGNGAADLIVAVGDIARVIDGPARSAGRHLLVQGPRLFATRTGGCATCPLRVRRTVLLSAHVTRRGNDGYVPLADLVLALEGRIEDPAGTGDIRIRAGSCCWCILEPGPR
jgi:hypothetical protein